MKVGIRLIKYHFPVRDFVTNEVTIDVCRIFRLLPGHPVYLLPRWPVDLAADVRFIGVFRDTWRRLPTTVRRRLLGYWRDDSSQRFTRAVISPLFEVVPSMAEWEENDSEDLLGMCSIRGHEVRFRTAVINRLPDKHLATVIAHELAHVYHYAIGDPTHMRPEKETADEAWLRGIESECSVRRMNQRWGFDEKGLDRWLTRNRRLQSTLIG